MSIQLDFSGLKAILSNFSVEQLLGASVLLLATAICLLVWRMKK